MDLAKLTLTALTQGWHHVANERQCNYCAANWTTETPLSTITDHLNTVHGGNLNQLIHLKSRYNSLTAKQQDLLTAFATGIKDQALAEQLQIAAATIRHQKFTFREKAKRAKLYLAIYNQVFNSAVFDDEPTIKSKPVSPSIDSQLDTETATAEILQSYFDFATEPIKLKQLPQQPATLTIVLKRIAVELPVGQPLPLAVLNAYLQPIYFDYSMLRHQLVANGFLKMTPDGANYWQPTA